MDGSLHKTLNCHQEVGFACTLCDARFDGMCKRAMKAKKDLALQKRGGPAEVKENS